MKMGFYERGIKTGECRKCITIFSCPGMIGETFENTEGKT